MDACEIQLLIMACLYLFLAIFHYRLVRSFRDLKERTYTVLEFYREAFNDKDEAFEHLLKIAEHRLNEDDWKCLNGLNQKQPQDIK